MRVMKMLMRLLVQLLVICYRVICDQATMYSREGLDQPAGKQTLVWFQGTSRVVGHGVKSKGHRFCVL